MYKKCKSFRIKTHKTLKPIKTTKKVKSKHNTRQCNVQSIKWTEFKIYSGWPQSRRNNILWVFHRLSQQKVNVIMTVIKGHDDPVYPYPVNRCFTQTMKYLNDELKIHCLFNFTLRLHRIHRIPWVQRNLWVFQVSGHPVIKMNRI